MVGSLKATRFPAVAALVLGLTLLAGCGSEKTIPDVKGQPAPVAKRVMTSAGLTSEIIEVFSTLPAGLVAGTEPAAGEKTSGGGVTIRVSKGPIDGTLPASAGLQGDLVADAMRSTGLTVEQTSVTSALAKAGMVVRSSPAAGQRPPRDGKVVLLVSGGARTTAIPDLAGQPLADALRSLRLARLQALVVPTPGVGKPNSVGSQSPAPGQVSAVGSTVRLWVNRQPRPVKVPKLVGLSGGSASVLMQGAGVDVRYTSVLARKPTEIGLVMKQSPSPGAVVQQGGSVTVEVGILPSREAKKPPTIGASFGLTAGREATFSMTYSRKDCPYGRGSAEIVPDLILPFKKGSATVTQQGPVLLTDGRIAQIAVVKTSGDYQAGSAEVAIRVSPCPKPR